MKSNIKYIIFFALLFSCTSNPRQDTISKVEDYTNDLKKIAPDSMKKIDTAQINANFNKNIESLNFESLKDIYNENSFKELLKTERKLLNKWEPVKGFRSYFGKTPDTLIKLIQRCASFDRAPLSAERVSSSRSMRAISLTYYKIEVPVAFHVIKNRKGAGLLPNMADRLRDQISALNAVYSTFNISFKLYSIDTTFNDTWFNSASYYEDSNVLKQMTKALSVQPEKVMNVYTLSPKLVLGESTFPWYSVLGTSSDYIVINYNTLPGGPAAFQNGLYTEGKTLIHEAGHFLGLFHTFEGASTDCQSGYNDGCGVGDQVDDTPSQKICYMTGCDVNADSCPEPGNDPVKNFMGYNPDACMTEMTEGQHQRLLQSILKYRYYLVINPI